MVAKENIREPVTIYWLEIEERNSYLINQILAITHLLLHQPNLFTDNLW